jgi:cytochrome P450
MRSGMSSNDSSQPLPVANPQQGLKILRALLRERSLLTPLRLMQALVGDVFQITLPAFQPAVLVGARANRLLLVQEREKFSWRVESDPVTKLLRRGLLVTDGAEHDALRALMEPTLQRGQSETYTAQMWNYVNAMTREWRDGQVRDMLIEMRRLALVILFGCLLRVEVASDLETLWQPILRVLEYISPGLWIVLPNLPRPTYRKSIRALDAYLYRIIAERRAELERDPSARTHGDLLTRLCLSELNDDAIRDQVLTMLIAGHDTSTALLAWTMYLFGAHPQGMAQARREMDELLNDENNPPRIEQLNRLEFLEQVIKESLRLYPPIHIGNRRATENVCVLDYAIPQDTRVMYSIYLAHRDPKHWNDAEKFCPERFHGSPNVPPLTYVPFGGGPRNCIGAAFSQIEAKVVLTNLLRQFDFELLNAQQIKPHMGATLEPRPGVKMRVTRRELD